jgi:hypothetical protein
MLCDFNSETQSYDRSTLRAKPASSDARLTDSESGKAIGSATNLSFEEAGPDPAALLSKAAARVLEILDRCATYDVSGETLGLRLLGRDCALAAAQLREALAVPPLSHDTSTETTRSRAAGHSDAVGQGDLGEENQ